ncbi:hypothetical protein [Candidatus Chloroploca asiatica]|uniref:hypothetical protein n=1 Tax=Candidatus Chloroploca asiatica TaxID=1506545 RepID=UPI0011448900|nr:hypothetical protein [Candidatus Chloroploca asiatica]
MPNPRHRERCPVRHQADQEHAMPNPRHRERSSVKPDAQQEGIKDHPPPMRPIANPSVDVPGIPEIL